MTWMIRITFRSRGKWMTLANLFTSTPDQEVLSKCRFRDWDQAQLPILLHNESVCYNIFKFKKVFSSGKMCYLFHPHQPSSDRGYWRLALNPINQRAIYSLSPNFGNIRNSLIEFVVYFGDDPPYWSKEHPVFTIGTNLRRIQFLSYNLYRVELLPSPYETRCSRSTSRFMCKYKCYSESVSKINRLSHGQIHREPSQHRILQFTDLTNQSTNDYWVSLEKRCYNKCKQTMCKFNYTVTKLGYSVDTSEFALELVITNSQDPVTTQVAIPRVTLYDLLYQVLCSLSFWLGFSFLSFDQATKKRLYFAILKRKLLLQLQRLNNLLTLIDHQRVLLKQVKRKMMKVRLRKVLPGCICAVGCFIHVACSLEYFHYPTILDTVRKFDTETSYTLTLCTDAYDFFATKTGVRQVGMFKAHDFHMLRSKTLNMSNEEMFKNTPDGKNIISMCRAWGGANVSRKVNDLSQSVHRLILTERNGTQCHKYFRVTKSFIQSKICYSFTPNVKLDWNRDQLDHVFHAGMSAFFYMISVNSSFVGDKFNVIATSSNRFFGYSAIWSSDVLEKFSFSRWHVVSYTKYIQRVLPPPYSDGGFTHMMHMKCIDLCINNLLEPFNKSLTSIFTIPSNRRLITFADRVGNDTFNDWLNERLERCEHKCKHTKFTNLDSHLEFTVTEISHGKPSKSSAFSKWRGPLLTSFYLRRSDSPVVVIIFKAKISFFEFLVTLGSIISIWFGLSVLGIPRSLVRLGQASIDQILLELQLKIHILRRLIRRI